LKQIRLALPILDAKVVVIWGAERDFRDSQQILNYRNRLDRQIALELEELEEIGVRSNAK